MGTQNKEKRANNRGLYSPHVNVDQLLNKDDLKMAKDDNKPDIILFVEIISKTPQKSY